MSELKPSFSVVSFKTANKNLNSLCHVSVAHYEEGINKGEFDSLIGLSVNEKVTNKKYLDKELSKQELFRDISPKLEKELTKGNIILTYGETNMKVLRETLGTLNPYDFFFCDVETLFKNTLKGKVKKLTLEGICDHFNILLEADNPISEAKAVGEIVLKRYEESRTFDRDIRTKSSLKRFVEFAR